MSEKLYEALDFFSQMIPDTEIGEYTKHHLDSNRLTKVAYLSYIYKENVTIENFEEAISKHKSVGEKFAESCYDYFKQIKEIIQHIDNAGYLIKSE